MHVRTSSSWLGIGVIVGSILTSAGCRSNTPDFPPPNPSSKDVTSSQTNDASSNNGPRPDTPRLGDSPPGRDITPGGAVTISDIQQIPAGIECSGVQFLDLLSDLTLQGVVITSPKFDAFTSKNGSTGADLDGYFIGDPAGGPFSGIQLVLPRADATDFQIGDTIDVQGSAGEFFCMSQVKAQSASVTSSGNPLGPQDIDVSDLANPTSAEKWEGVLIRVRDVVVEEAGKFGEFTLQGGAIVDDMFMKDQLGIAAGDQLGAITGIVTFSFGTFKIEPRNPGDIKRSSLPPRDVTRGDTGSTPDTQTTDPGLRVDAGAPDTSPATRRSIEMVQMAQESTSCTADGAQFGLDGVRLEDAIVVSPRFSASANLDGYLVSDPDGGAWGGVQLVVAKDEATDFQLGDVLGITGTLMEFFCNTQVKSDSIEVIRSGAAIPAPADISAGVLAGENAEQFEGVLVRLSQVKVASGPDQFGEFVLESGETIDNLFMGPDFSLTVGGTLTSITGVVRFRFGKYKLAPRSPGDIVTP